MSWFERYSALMRNPRAARLLNYMKRQNEAPDYSCGYYRWLESQGRKSSPQPNVVKD